MKRIATILALTMLAAATATAQVVLTVDDFTSLAGTTLQISGYDADTPAALAPLVGLTGAGQTFDFTATTWTASGSDDIRYTSDIASVVGGTEPEFASATFAFEADEDRNGSPDAAVFWAPQSDGVLDYGLYGPDAGGDIKVSFSPALERYDLPLALNTTWSSTSTQTSSGGGGGDFSVDYTLDADADAEGTCILPGGISEPCLRVDQTITVDFGGFESVSRSMNFIVKDQLIGVSLSLTAGGDVTGASYSVTDAVLPVELTRFEGFVDGDAVELRWETASETSNAGFDVLHEQEGRWTERGWVAGAGTTTRPHAYRFRVERLDVGVHRFRLRQRDADGSARLGPIVEVDVTLPGRVALLAAYPNPFNPATRLAVELGEAGPARVAVYDVLGREVAVLADGALPAGRTVLAFDASALPAGLYVARLQAAGQVRSRSLVYLP